jgi:hypothetical protein
VFPRRTCKLGRRGYYTDKPVCPGTSRCRLGLGAPLSLAFYHLFCGDFGRLRGIPNEFFPMQGRMAASGDAPLCRAAPERLGSLAEQAEPDQ